MSEINDYVFNGEGSEPSVDNSEAAQNSTESIPEYVFGAEAWIQTQLVIPAPTAANIGKYLRATGAYTASWQAISLEDVTIPWGNLTGTLSDQTDLQAALDGKQAGNANLTSLAALSYVSVSFVKMTAAGTFALDTTVLGSAAQADTGDFDAAGSAASVASDLSDHESATGTSVHGLGTASTHAEGDFQAANANLTSLEALSYVSTSFVKMTGANTFALDINEYVIANSAITGATKTKITYDAKGLITSGADATTADIADSTNRRYCTDAEKTVIGNTSGTNSGDETTTTLGSKINSATEKTTPVNADMVGLMDSVASNILKKLSWSNIKATLKTYFDTLYAVLTPTGSIKMWPNATPPSGFVVCNGQELSRSTYSGLFGLIGTDFGVGDGSTTFNVPDFTEAAPVGVGTRGSGVTAHDAFALGEFKDDQFQAWQAGLNSGAEIKYGNGKTFVDTEGTDWYGAYQTAVSGQGVSDMICAQSDGTNGTPRTGTVTRGKRYGIYFIIKT